MSWTIRNERPEELFAGPDDFYTEEEVEKYASLSSMQRTQRKLAVRLIELLEAAPPGKALDIGCGVGYSAKFLEEIGFDVKCIDCVRLMVEKANEQGLDVTEGDMTELEKHYDKESFDIIISISAFQWVKHVKKAVDSIYHVLKKGGKAGIQFYPKSEKEMKAVATAFARKFRTEVIIDNPDVARKRTIFILLEK